MYAISFVPHTSLCLAGSEYRMFRPKHNTGLGPGSTQRRPSHTHCSGEGELGQCLCQSRHTAVAVKTHSEKKKKVWKEGFRNVFLSKLETAWVVISHQSNHLTLRDCDDFCNLRCLKVILNVFLFNISLKNFFFYISVQMYSFWSISRIKIMWNQFFQDFLLQRCGFYQKRKPHNSMFSLGFWGLKHTYPFRRDLHVDDRWGILKNRGDAAN